MKVFVKNKFASLGGSSTVTDEAGNRLFNVKGKLFSITKKKKIYDMDGKLQYIVKNKFFNWWTHACFILSPEKQKIAMLKNRGFKRGYDVLGYADEFSIEGQGMGYSIVKNGNTIGLIRSNFMSLVDNFEIDVEEGENPAFLVAMIIAMDNIRDRKGRT